MNVDIDNIDNHEDLGRLLGQFVDEKNKAYQNSFEKVGRIIPIMIEGLTSDEVREALPSIVFVARLLDKLIRHIRNTGKGGDAMSEDPRADLVGYMLLDCLQAVKDKKTDVAKTDKEPEERSISER